MSSFYLVFQVQIHSRVPLQGWISFGGEGQERPRAALERPGAAPGAVVRREALRPEGHAECAAVDQRGSNINRPSPGAVVRREALRPEGHAERAPIDQRGSNIHCPLAWPALQKRRSTTAPGFKLWQCLLVCGLQANKPGFTGPVTTRQFEAIRSPSRYIEDNVPYFGHIGIQ